MGGSRDQNTAMGATLSTEARKRILQALQETLENELTSARQALDMGGVKASTGGPWRMLYGDSGWSEPTQLSRELFAQIRGEFSDDIVREILLAAAGVKVSRTSLSEAKLALLRSIATEHGFCVLASADRYIHRRDKGKGGCCNAIERAAGPDEDSGLRIVYVASDSSLTSAAMLLEQAGDDQLFGMLLGIPSCCREAYARFQPTAMAKQFDLVPMALDNTPGEMPYDAWVNYPAVYFGRALLSFFPCSFRCPSAGTVARSTFKMLAECDAAWAHTFLEFHQTNILYTEYQGVHMFRSPIVDRSIRYKPSHLRSTEPTDLAGILRSGDRLRVRGKRHVDVYRGLERIAALEGEDVSMCAFR